MVVVTDVDAELTNKKGNDFAASQHLAKEFLFSA